MQRFSNLVTLALITSLLFIAPSCEHSDPMYPVGVEYEADHPYWDSIEVIDDSTGSLDPVLHAATIEAIIASLPVLVDYGCGRIFISGWGRFSTWAPHVAMFPMPLPDPGPVVPQAPHFIKWIAPNLAYQFEAEAAEAYRFEHERADSLWACRIKHECAKAGDHLRMIAKAGRCPEPYPSPVNELYLRCARQPIRRLTLTISDGVGPDAPVVPDSSLSHTILILVPSTIRPNSVLLGLKHLQGTAWLTVVPASDIDPAGEWVSNLIPQITRGRADRQPDHPDLNRATLAQTAGN